MTNKKKPLTSKAYIKASGSVCPYCGSENICGGSIDPDGKTAVSRVDCNNCQHYWFDEWTLTSWFPC